VADACRAQELDPPSFIVPGPVKDSRQVEDGGRGVSMSVFKR
jgi:hypothetical protein